MIHFYFIKVNKPIEMMMLMKFKYLGRYLQVDICVGREVYPS